MDKKFRHGYSFFEVTATKKATIFIDDHPVLKGLAECQGISSDEFEELADEYIIKAIMEDAPWSNIEIDRY